MSNVVDREKQILENYAPDPYDTLSISDFHVNQILRDHAGRLWISTSGGGLNRMDEYTGTFVRYQHDPADSTSLSHDYVNCVFESHSGVLWVGTINGLNRLDPEKGTFDHYSEREGLPDNSIAGMLEDQKGYLWLMTSNGISRFDPHQTGAGAFRHYDAGDGLHGDEFMERACFQAPDGEIFAGGQGGFTSFHPDVVHDNPYIPPIVLTSLKINGRSVHPVEGSPVSRSIPYTREILLPYDHNNLTFEFSALDYLNPLKNSYAYMLEGVDEHRIFSPIVVFQ